MPEIILINAFVVQEFKKKKSYTSDSQIHWLGLIFRAEIQNSLVAKYCLYKDIFLPTIVLRCQISRAVCRLHLGDK